MRKGGILSLAFAVIVLASGVEAGEGTSGLENLSLDSLLNISVTAAAKHEQREREAPASVTIITAEDIKRYGYRTLAEVLRDIRGFYISYDRNYTYLGVRGFSRPTDYNDRILLLLNGHILNENVYGSAFIGTELGLDLGTIDRIEIIRGPGSALYGTGAMFAVINIITKKGHQVEGLRVSGEYGSYRRLEGTFLAGKRIGRGIELLASGIIGDVKGQDLYFEEFDDPETNNGIAEGLDWDKYRGGFLQLSVGDLNVMAMATSRKKGVPTGAWEVDFNNKESMTLDERQFIEFSYDKKFDVSKALNVRAFFDRYNYKGVFPYREEDYSDDWCEGSVGKWAGAEVRFRWDPAADDRLIAGFEYMKHFRADYRSWDSETTYFNGNFPFSIFSIYLQNEYQITGELTFVAGGRWDSYSRTKGSLTPRAALIYNPTSKTTLKLLYGDAFRAPNVYETFYEDEDEAKSNPELDPEKIRTLEMILEHRINENLFGVLSLYRYKMEDIIEQVQDPVDSLWQFQNVGSAKARGAEVALNSLFRNGIRGFLSCTIQKAENTRTHETLSNSPSLLVKAGLVVPASRYLFVATDLIYETERITVYRTKTHPYLLANLNLSTSRLWNHFEADFRVENIFNVKYEHPGGYEHVQDALEQDGRNFRFKLSFLF